VLSWSRD